jgi:hypothetical protein
VRKTSDNASADIPIPHRQHARKSSCDIEGLLNFGRPVKQHGRPIIQSYSAEA